MKYLYWLFLCLPLLLSAQSKEGKGLSSEGAPYREPAGHLPSGLQRAATLQDQPPTSAIKVERGAHFEEAMRKLGPDLITPRLTINTNVLDNLLDLVKAQPDVRLILAVDHSALSVRYALVHRLLEHVEVYPEARLRVDVEMYAPISNYHTTWLYSRGVGHLMIRLERLSR